MKKISKVLIIVVLLLTFVGFNDHEEKYNKANKIHISVEVDVPGPQNIVPVS